MKKGIGFFILFIAVSMSYAEERTRTDYSSAIGVEFFGPADVVGLRYDHQLLTKFWGAIGSGPYTTFGEFRYYILNSKWTPYIGFVGGFDYGDHTIRASDDDDGPFFGPSLGIHKLWIQWAFFTDVAFFYEPKYKNKKESDFGPSLGIAVQYFFNL